MKKMFQFMKAVTLMLMAVTMFLGTNTITANAQTMYPGCMEVAEDGRIKITCDATTCGVHSGFLDDASGRRWEHTAYGDPFCYYKETRTEQRKYFEVEITTLYFDCYLTDYIRSHDESEWPSFVIKGSDGIPFYYEYDAPDGRNYDIPDEYCVWYYARYCYDEKTGFWVWDKSYKGPYYGSAFGPCHYETVKIEDLIAQTKEDIANGKEVNGKAKKPAEPQCKDNMAEYDPDTRTVTCPDGSVIYPDGHTEYADGRVEYIYKYSSHSEKRIVYPDGHEEYYSTRIEYPDGSTEFSNYYHLVRTEYPDGRIVYPDGRIVYPDGRIEYSDVDENTLGAAVTLSTDCIKVKTNKKGVVAQKPLPKTVKVGNKTLKRNKTFVVSYEKYEDGRNTWDTVSAVTGEGTYRLVITGQNGYEGVYKKRLYVTADKTIKAMSSVAVKVNKVPYSGEPVTSGVIKTVKVGKRTLEEGTDYTVTYKNNLNSGTGQVTLTAVEGSGLLGTKTVNFTITGNKMNKVKVTGLKPLVYDPNAQMVQNMSDIQLTYNGNQLVEGTDFTLAYANNVKAGTAKMIFTGKGLYNGTLTKTFKITKMPLNDGMLDEASKNIELTYTKKALKPEVKLAVSGTELKKGTDYTLAYSNNVKVSTETKPAWITVKGKGSYSGSFKVSFTIVPEGDDNTAKPNTGVNTVMTEEVPEEDDTVSGNDIPEEDDTVSGNDLPEEDDTVSGNDLPETDDETPAEDETVSDNDLPAEDETPAAEEEPVAEDESVTGDEPVKEDEAVTDEESAEESTEPIVFATKPVAYVVCDCECIMPIYTVDWSDVEKTTWYEHLHEHERSGLQAHYNSVTYEQALKYKLISEDENGWWTLLKGTLLLPPEAETEETEEPQTEETEESAVEESQIEEATVEVTEESEAEVDPDKPVGEGMNHIENYF